MLAVLAGVFGWAGFLKFTGASEFSHVIARFDLLPLGWVNPVAIMLPMVEITLAVALLVPAFRRPALLGIQLFCVIFAVALASAIARGIPVSCGCFGGAEAPSKHAAWLAIGRDLLLFSLAWFLYARQLASRRSSHQSIDLFLSKNSKELS